MDEYLSEKEQIERIKGWWQDNGWYLIGGVVIGLVGLFGYNQYTDYRDSRAEESAAVYLQLESAVNDDDLDAVNAHLARLKDEYSGSPYTDHGALLAARFVLVRDPERAAEELRYVLDTTDDDELAMIARIRLARVLAYREEYAAALDMLDVGRLGQFAARIYEVRGDIYLAQGEVSAAYEAFDTALRSPGSENLDRSFVQMKRDDLQVETTLGGVGD